MMRILIIKLSAIGDVVHTLPAVAMLKRALPDAHLAWVVERRASAILQGSQAIDELIELDTRAWRKNPFQKTARKAMREQVAMLRDKFDIAIDFQGLLKSGLVAKATYAPRRIGFASEELREKASRVFLTEQVSTASLQHIIDKNLALASSILPASAVCSSTQDYEFPIGVSSEDEQYIAEQVTARADSFAILNPGGGWVTKLWDTVKFGAVADWLWQEYGIVSFVTYGPGEEHLAQSVAEHSRQKVAIPLASTLKQFVALARRASLFVGGDTGPLHIAAACRTPIVGLYGPTLPERNGPFDKNDITVGRDLWCRMDCHKRKCWHWRCMEISVEEVMQAIASRLASAKNANNQPQPLAFNV
jgi:lipopolysaccharide heptosyltransferase I